MLVVKLRVKADIALPGGTPPQSYGTSLAIWDHTVLPIITSIDNKARNYYNSNLKLIVVKCLIPLFTARCTSA